MDTNPESKNFGIALSNFNEMEPHLYPIKRVASNEYVVLKSRENDSNWARVVFEGKQLRFIEGSIVSGFVKSKKSNEYNLDHYFDDNVDLLNKALTTKGYPKLEEIVKENALKCDCNKWMGRKNVLFVQGSPKSWIIEMKNDSLQISKIVNTDRDPDDLVEVENLASYKWK